MTICVSVKSRDGVVLGTDSMMQVMLQGPTGQLGFANSYTNARKLLQVGQLPIGVFTYGAGNLGSRSISGLIMDFSTQNKAKRVEEVAAGLSDAIGKAYSSATGNAPESQKPILGLFVAGYSPHSALAEEWEVEFPSRPTPQPVRPSHDFGASWRGVPMPFSRLHNGFDPRHVDMLRQLGVSEQIIEQVFQNNQYAAQVFFDAMPVQDAINFAAYVLRTTIAFAEFEIGPSPCGGPLQLAAITHENGFCWINEPKLSYPEG